MQQEYISEKTKFQIEEAILIVLIILSVIGIAISDFSAHDGYMYWLALVFIFAGSAIGIAWLQSKQQETVDFSEIVKEQSLHWITTLLVVGGAFLLQKSGQLNEVNASLVILLILSLATMLDGNRIGWHFSFVGLFLGMSSIIIAFFDSFMWVVCILAIAIVAMTILWEIWMNKRAEKYADF